jgi:hypothetical protein
VPPLTTAPRAQQFKYDELAKPHSRTHFVPSAAQFSRLAIAYCCERLGWNELAIYIPIRAENYTVFSLSCAVRTAGVMQSLSLSQN